MEDDEFERIMRAWAKHEASSAPDMHPTEEMYRLVRARHRQGLVWRWACMGIVVIALTVFVIALLGNFTPGPPGKPVALVGQREGFGETHRPVPQATTTPGGKGPARGALQFTQLQFHYQMQGSTVTVGVDIQAPSPELITLTAADNYQLLLRPAQACHAVVFQRTAGGGLVKLFPNELYTPIQNPLQAEVAYTLPAAPNWFYLVDQQAGEERLYIIASRHALGDLEALYERYIQAKDAASQEQSLANLLRTLDAFQGLQDETVAGWQFMFYHQPASNRLDPES